MSEQIFTAQEVQEGIKIFRAVIERSLMMPNASTYDRQRRSRVMGGATSHVGARDYYTVLGYPDQLDFDDYLTLYERAGMAGQIVDLPATDSWNKQPQITEKDNENTAFVKAWNDLDERLHVWEVLRRADELSGIGSYGAVVFGLAGEDAPDKPVDKDSRKGLEQLLYLRPFSAGGAEVVRLDEKTSSKRCGYPEMYNVRLTEKQSVHFHHSRVLHLADNRTNSEVYGRPRLARSYNTVSDLVYKVLGGSSETFWLNQRSGIHASPKEGYDIDLSDSEVVSGLTDQFEAWAHDLVRILIDDGMDVENIGGATPPDPSNMFDALLDDIAATVRIPKRVLLGSAAGELAAAKEDRKQWAAYIAGRQKSYVEPRIFRPFIDRLVWYGILPQPKDGYEIGKADKDGKRHWPSILTPDEEEQAAISLRRASAAKQTADPATGKTVLTDKELRVTLGQPADVPDDMKDTEKTEGRFEPPPEPLAEPEVPEEQPEDTLIEPPEDEPDEETEQARVNELFVASHRPTIVTSVCPLCGFTQAESYEGHGPLLRCANDACKKTYDPTVEGPGVVLAVQEDGDNANAQATE